MNDILKTDKGLMRENNEDYIMAVENENGDRLYILCDGMGGYNGGEIASKECALYIKSEFQKTQLTSLEDTKQWLYETIILSNKKIKTLSEKNEELHKMGTTLICLLITENYRLYANVGDSRLYAYNKKDFRQISEDQTFANALLKAGYISEKEAEIHPKRNLLLSAIGSNEEDLDIQIKEIGISNYLLCSDGLYNMVSFKEISKILRSELSLEDKATKLIELANENGGKDNVSIILVEDSL